MRLIYLFAKIGIFAVLGAVIIGNSAMAADMSGVCVQKKLSEATLIKGFTVKCKGFVQLAIPAGAVSESVVITIAKDVQTDILAKLPNSVKVLSPIITVQAKSAAEDAHAVIFTKALPIVLQILTTELWTKELYQYDEGAAQWQRLSSGTDWSKGQIKATLKSLPAIIIATETRDKIEGVASWYGDKRVDSAASNDFPMGTKLRVHNPETKKSVDVVVRSKGPFVIGRVIDLSSKAFSKIQSKWKGVAKVVVEKL